MSSLNKSQLRTENSDNFPNNNSQFITPEKLRDFNNDVIDSMVVNQDTGSYLITSSFDTGSRDMTFTKVDGTTYTNNIPSGSGGSSDTGSLLITASVVDATTTYTKGNGDIFTTTIDNVANSVSSSYAVSSSQAENATSAVSASSATSASQAENATSAVSASSATSASHAEQADNATSSSNSISSSVVTDPNIAYINKDNTFTGTQSFLNISVSGTGSFGRIEAVTGSAKIIGDAFVVVNADTPTLRYAGLQVYDSGSSATASIEWDGGTDSWILVEEGGQSSFILTGPTGSKGSEVDLTNNTIPKAGAHRQLVDSIISDDGSTATIGGDLNVTGTIGGIDSGSFALLGAANLFTGGTQASVSENGLFLSKPNYPSSSFQQKKLWDLSSQNIPIGTGTYNVYQNSFTHFNGYGRWYENGTYFTEMYDGGSFNYGSEQSFNGGGTQLFVIASGSGGLSSGNHAQFQVQDNFDGTAGINLDAQKIYIGQSSSARLAPADIRIGGSASVLVSGSNGYVNQVMAAPAHPSEKPQTTIVGASNGGTPYNRVFQGIVNYSGYGLPETEDAFAIEYFDGNSYNNGSQFYLNGKSTELGTKAGGGGLANQSIIKLQDNGDTSSTVTIKGTNVNIGTTGGAYPSAITNTITIGQTGNAVVVSGSLQSSVSAIGISSQTASLNFNGPSLQTIELVSGSDTRLEVANRKEGVTINLKVKQPGTGFGNLILDAPFLEPRNSPYTASQESDAKDILTFVTFEASDTSVYVANVKTLS